jgi:hypothetical protein
LISNLTNNSVINSRVKLFSIITQTHAIYEQILLLTLYDESLTLSLKDYISFSSSISQNKFNNCFDYHSIILNKLVILWKSISKFDFLKNEEFSDDFTSWISISTSSQENMIILISILKNKMSISNPSSIVYISKYKIVNISKNLNVILFLSWILWSWKSDPINNVQKNILIAH